MQKSIRLVIWILDDLVDLFWLLDGNMLCLQLNKMYDSARKEKETMVMRFANAEKDKLKVARYKEDVERKVKEASRDREMLLGKMKQLTIERNHLAANLESKVFDAKLGN